MNAFKSNPSHKNEHHQIRQAAACGLRKNGETIIGQANSYRIFN